MTRPDDHRSDPTDTTSPADAASPTDSADAMSPSAGRLRYATRPRPGWAAWSAVVAAVGVGAVLGYLGPERSPVHAALMGAFLGLFVLLLGASGWVEQHRVHDRALLLGPTLPGASPYVVPLGSIDPDTITVHRRANRIGRRLRQNGLPNLRMAPYSVTAVSFRGRHFDLAHPRRRGRADAGQRITAALLGGTDADEGPTCRWVLAVRDPEPLLRALESALGAAGVDAAGSADRALAAPVDEPAASATPGP